MKKVDYAILNNGNPVILIEAKWIKEDLQKHDSQLFRYFGTSQAKFAILTNGLIYRFFTDLEEPNKMDEKPFLEINILDIKENQVSELKKFHKSAFNIDEIFDTASQLKYTNEFKNAFAQELQSPSDDLVRLFLTNVYSGVKTQTVIEKFKPLVKKSLNQYITETMNDKLKTVLDTNDLKQEIQEEPVDEIIEEKKIITTQEELEAYFIIKNILKSEAPIQDITYKDNERYMSILYKTKATKWICRLYFNSSNKYIAFPDENKKEIKIALESIYDIENYNQQLVDVLMRYM